MLKFNYSIKLRYNGFTLTSEPGLAMDKCGPVSTNGCFRGLTGLAAELVLTRICRLKEIVDATVISIGSFNVFYL
jgi:hypothetical protein